METQERILVVDPDRQVVEALDSFLTREGYKVVTARDGKDALELCAKLLPDIVILEGLIPRLTGIELSKAIRLLPNGGMVSIMMTSAVYASAKFASDIKDAQIDEVLAKPYTYEGLLKKIKSLKVHLETRRKSHAKQEAERFDHAGNLEVTPFVRIAFHIYSRKLSGTLRLQSGTTKKLVTFEDGEPRFVVSNLQKECLGQVLVKKGRLTAEECESSLARMTELKSRQGEVLIQMGLIEPYELDEALKQQAREKFCEIFSWKEGEYIFVEGKIFDKDLTPVDLSVPQLCLRGVKEHYSLAMLMEALVPYAESIPEFREGKPFTLADLKLATWDMKIARQIRLRKSISKILDMHLARDIDVYHLFYTLWKLGLIKVTRKTLATEQEISAFEHSGFERKGEPELSPFEMLEVSLNSDDETVQKAYDAKVVEIDETFEGTKRDHKLKQVKDAFERISSHQGRRDFIIRTYEDGGDLPPDAREIFQAEEFLEIGKKFLDEKKFSQAQKVFGDGFSLFSDEGLLCTYLGYSYIRASMAGENVPEKELDRARVAMVKATQISPMDPETHFLLGRVFALENDYEKAKMAFRRTMTLNPEHDEAPAELRVIERRMEKQKTQSFIKWKR